MEFKAIVDAKARTASGCAVVGVYENGELGNAARHIDAQIGGILGRLHKTLKIMAPLEGTQMATQDQEVTHSATPVCPRP